MEHLYSTHKPYDPPVDLRQQYLDPAYKGPIQAFYSVQREAIESGRYAPTPEDVQRIRDLYYAGVAHADRMIGELVESLRAKGVLDSTLVIVTSDHGESLGEDGLWEHDHMVQTNLRIPLVMRWPQGLPTGKRVAGLTESIDLLPTICELALMRLPVEESEVRAFGEIDGRSLMPLVRGEATSVREHSFAENAYFQAVQDGRHKLLVDARAWQEPTLVAARAVKERFLPRCYDLQLDPEERSNVLEAHPQQAEALFQALRRWNEGLPVRRMEESHRDLEMKARFQLLGYTGGDEQAPHQAPR
jgi:arylsulfatase A-like enzyme